MPNQSAEEMRNYVNYIERKIREELDELGTFMNEKYEELEKYKKSCLLESHDDEEVAELVEDEIENYQSRNEDQELTAEEEKRAQEIYEEYYEKLEESLSEIETFEEAEECNYLKYKNSSYSDFIREGMEIEQLIKKLDSFLINNF